MFKLNKTGAFTLLIFTVFLIPKSLLFAQTNENITITTYYPSPYGSYDKLQTNSLGVGDNNGSGGLEAGDIPTNPGYVWIAGRVGIGTTAPNDLLQVKDLISFGGLNTFLGYQAGQVNTTGSLNIGIGYGALATNTTGLGNIAIGQSALMNNNAGGSNIAIGTLSLQTAASTNNEAIGHYALYALSTGAGNTVIGYDAGRLLGTGSRNVIMGWEAGYGSGSGYAGDRNTLIGTAAGHSFGVSANGISSNVFIGYGAGYYETRSNRLFIDNQARSSQADAPDKALIYGVFDASPANQALTVNGAVGIGTTDIWGKLAIQGTYNATAITIRPTANEETAIQWCGPGGCNYITKGAADNNLYFGGTPNGLGCQLPTMTVGTSTTVGCGGYSGYVGIGTTAPDTKLSVYFPCADTYGFIERLLALTTNSYAAGSGTAISFQAKGAGAYLAAIAGVAEQGTPNYLNYSLRFYTMRDTYGWGNISERMRITSGGTVAIGTVNPDTNYKLHVNGSIKATCIDSPVACSSSRDLKKNICPLSKIDYTDVLTKIKNTNVVRYHLKTDEPGAKLHIGVIAEDSPQEITTENNKGVRLTEYLGFLLAGLKAQQQEIEALKEEMSRIKK